MCSLNVHKRIFFYDVFVRWTFSFHLRVILLTSTHFFLIQFCCKKKYLFIERFIFKCIIFLKQQQEKNILRGQLKIYCLRTFFSSIFNNFFFIFSRFFNKERTKKNRQLWSWVEMRWEKAQVVASSCAIVKINA